MATRSSVLAEKPHGQRLAVCSSWDLQGSDTAEATYMHTHSSRFVDIQSPQNAQAEFSSVDKAAWSLKCFKRWLASCTECERMKTSGKSL